MKKKKKRMPKNEAWNKTRLRLPDLDQAKTAVLNSLRSPESQRGYKHAIDEFIAWYCSEPRLSFNKPLSLGTEYPSNLASSHRAPLTSDLPLSADWRTKRRIPGC